MVLRGGWGGGGVRATRWEKKKKVARAASCCTLGSAAGASDAGNRSGAISEIPSLDGAAGGSGTAG